MSQAKPRHLLDGYKVLDFTHFVAGPTATRMMAGMGAEVVKVELAPHGDQARTVAFLRDKRSAYFIQQNRGKKGICVDMKKPAGAGTNQRAASQVRRDGGKLRPRHYRQHGARL